MKALDKRIDSQKDKPSRRMKKKKENNPVICCLFRKGK